jgi:hypothetical protein
VPALLAPARRAQAVLSYNGNHVDVECTAAEGGRYSCSYTAQAAGRLVLEVTSGGKHLSGSPFAVQVREAQRAAGSTGTKLCMPYHHTRRQLPERQPPPPCAAAQVFASRAEAQEVELADAAAARLQAAGQQHGLLDRGPADQSLRWAQLARDVYAADGDMAGWDSDGDQQDPTEEERFIEVGARTEGGGDLHACSLPTLRLCCSWLASLMGHCCQRHWLLKQVQLPDQWRY